MQALPVFMKIAGRKVVVIGGGTPAARKSEMALRCGALVSVFAEHLGEDFREIEGEERLTHVARAVTGPDMD
ncbi:MAG: NAD(P)-dependent oxidoreductase, partial [Rhizobiaceae bacterium]